MLTASTTLHLLANGFSEVRATLFEVDETLTEHLESVLRVVQDTFHTEGKTFEYEVINEDFVVSRPDKNSHSRYDVAVINPPYFKYSAKHSTYAKRTADLFKGDPNVYASFIAVTMACLASNGQAVVISPRSFLNGLYFKGFRRFMLEFASLERIHIFKSRKNVFVDSDVLQENIIIKLTITEDRLNELTISSSYGLADIQNPTISVYPKNIIVDSTNGESIMRIPESKSDFEVLQIAESLPSTFTNEGY